VSFDPTAPLPNGFDLLIDDFKRLMTDESTADVEIVCQGHVFKRHRCILSTRCEFFRAAFGHDMVESSRNSIVMDNIHPEVMQVVLTFIYSGKFNWEVLRPVHAAPDAAENELEVDLVNVKMMKNLLDLSHAADYMLLPSLRDVAHFEISRLAGPTRYEDMQLLYDLTQIVNPHPSLLNQLYSWVHAFCTKHPPKTNDPGLYGLLSGAYKKELEKFVAFTMQGHQVYNGEVDVRGLIHMLRKNTELPRLRDFVTKVESAEQLHDLFALHRLCEKWVPSDKGCKQNKLIIPIAKFRIQEKGFDLMIQDQNGNAPLHCAVIAGSVALVKMILEAGVDTLKSIMNKNLETPCDLARKQDVPKDGRSAIFSLLDPALDVHFPEWFNDYDEDIKRLNKIYPKISFEWMPNSDQNALDMRFFSFSFPKYCKVKAHNRLSATGPLLAQQEKVLKQVLIIAVLLIILIPPFQKAIDALKEDLYYRLAKKIRPEFKMRNGSCSPLIQRHTANDEDESGSEDYSDEYSDDGESWESG
jgi:hypothetical protein